MDQRTDEWYAARLGKVTASMVHDATARGKSGYYAARANYMTELLLERLTGNQAEGFTSAAMQWGIDQEPAARERYEFLTGFAVEEVGFMDHPTIAMTGASPDGLVGDDGLLEIKCPNSATHLQTLLSGKIPLKYQSQMLWQMECAERDWCDFVSFDPRFPAEHQFFQHRFEYDEEKAKTMRDEVQKFLTELDEKLTNLKG